ncbi:hypothetical protein B0T14DRAFT_523582 [Immersiella caudata]|uniref:Uncharacterized protein n=1 Tax=Immersiella caudata TaxID=314043 RepID=A0AA39WJP1_9PEZI|nr:hypothetical protein B0T14DRAFT_523582 [Immersiella caudata]
MWRSAASLSLIPSTSLTSGVLLSSSRSRALSTMSTSLLVQLKVSPMVAIFDFAFARILHFSCIVAGVSALGTILISEVYVNLLIEQLTPEFVPGSGSMSTF